MNLSLVLPHLNPLYFHQPARFVLHQFLKRNKLSIEADVLEQKLMAHPHFPSLLSISDVLHELGIAHQAYRTDLDTFIKNYARPVLSHLKMGDSLFAVVEYIRGKFKITSEKGAVLWLDRDEFVKAWGGIVLEIASSQDKKLKHNSSKRNEAYPAGIRFALLAIGGVITFYYLQAYVHFSSPTQMALLVLNVTGLVLSWLLVLQHLNKNNALVQQLCNSKTKEGCQSVLGSKPAQLTPWLSMADAGLAYFAGSALITLIYGVSTLGIVLALAAPLLSMYAIYLQGFVIKQWCKLCMAVHGVVFVTAILATLDLTQEGIIFPDLPQVLVFLVLGLFWMGIKPWLKRMKQARYYRQEYLSLKSNPDLFNALLKKQPKIHIPEELKVLSFGNVEATHELVMVSNPFCGPCGSAHATLHKWLTTEPDFRISIITGHPEDSKDPRRQFMELICGATGEVQRQEAVHNWFKSGERDLDKWALRHSLQKKELSYTDAQMRHWLDLAEVHATPTFFVNGRKLPASYRLEDIRHLVTEAD